MQKKIQNVYPTQNSPLNNFALDDRFHIPDGSRDIAKGTKVKIFTIKSRYIANVNTSDPYISQTNRKMVSIMERKNI